MYQFLLERPPETLHWRIIVTVTRAAHRWLQVEMAEHLLIFMGAVLAASVRVMNQSARRTLDGHGFKQGLAYQVPGQALAHSVAHDFTVKQILVPGQIQPPFVRRHTGDVA